MGEIKISTNSNGMKFQSALSNHMTFQNNINYSTISLHAASASSHVPVTMSSNTTKRPSFTDFQSATFTSVETLCFFHG